MGQDTWFLDRFCDGHLLLSESQPIDMESSTLKHREASGFLQVSHEKGGEFLMQMRWDAGLETSSFPFVMPFNDLADLVQASNHARAIMRDGQLQKLTDWTQLTAQLFQ